MKNKNIQPAIRLTPGPHCRQPKDLTYWQARCNSNGLHSERYGFLKEKLKVRDSRTSFEF